MLLPWIVPEIVTALAWKSIYDPIFGGLNPILLGAGIISQPLGWLSDPNLAMPSIIAVNVWKGIPFYVLLLLAGLKAIDREQLEAAEVDGANVVQRFRHVTLPGLRYVIVVVLLLSFISTFNQFGLHLPDDRRRPERRHQALFDPRLREGHRLAAIRAGHGHRVFRRAADGGADLAAGQVHAPRRQAASRPTASPSIGDRLLGRAGDGPSTWLLDLVLPARSSSRSRASRRSPGWSARACGQQRPTSRCSSVGGQRARRPRRCGCSSCCPSWSSCSSRSTG